MQEVIKKANKSISKFDIMDWSIFKTCMILFGTIIGCTFSEECNRFRQIIFIIWIVCFHYLMFKIYLAPDK
ncbi:hypothetical protein AN640_05410 [Candidatus Epulonipiscium fishelsonii]|uniref:Uncharacterized protein n=1 Tax=Candidatus Epulonipiscium fishelsonii TaxID=77094 RepID=A0ACC8XIH0_9FIRM|nr:hypothetical protein AN640_05410 [Epulopiscium sp. SCG-D08WGA-EpuloA1]OON93082.1 MAG: hypothetical protein ATN32_01795 [Epulopiscium sp. AS2M-Bin002]